MKQSIKNIITRFGYEINRIDPDKENQIGSDPTIDMGRYLSNDHPLIFDVGANTGQSIRNFQERFPNSIIHSFEPSPTTFKKLKEKVSEVEAVSLWNCALGSQVGEMTLQENLISEMSSFLSLGEFGFGEVIRETLVDVKTIDQFCHDENIDQIDILKSDTQGFDLEVLKGAEGMIGRGKVGLVYLEMNFRDMYKNLPSFAEIYDFLDNSGFMLVSFYQLRYQQRVASWTDGLFVHRSYIE